MLDIRRGVSTFKAFGDPHGGIWPGMVAKPGAGVLGAGERRLARRDQEERCV